MLLLQLGCIQQASQSTQEVPTVYTGNKTGSAFGKVRKIQVMKTSGIQNNKPLSKIHIGFRVLYITKTAYFAPTEVIEVMKHVPYASCVSV